MLVAFVAFGPIARARIRAEAEKHELEVQVGGVRPGWFSVRLADCVVRSRRVPSLEVHIDQVRVGLSVWLKPQLLDLHGVRIVGDGDPATARDQLRGSKGPDGGSNGSALELSGEEVAIEWHSKGPSAFEATLTGLSFHRSSSGEVHIAVRDAALQREEARLTMAGATCELAPAQQLRSVHADRVALEWLGSPRLADTASPTQVIPVAAVRDPAPAQPASASQLLDLPQPRALRARLAAIVALLAERLPVGIEAGVDALSLKLANRTDVPLTVGPGLFTLRRTALQIELRYSADPHAESTSLTVRAVLPTGDGDPSITLDGGPLALSALGVQEGTAGLVDVAHATVGGRARFQIAGDGSATSFDVDVSGRGISLKQSRLAADTVRGLDLELRTRGLLSDAGELRLDDFAVGLGAIHTSGSGSFDQQPDHASASFQLELPSTPCQALLESIPTALLPDLQGMRWSGTFGVRARFAFDTRTLDDLELAYDIQDQCRAVEVPPALARERFKQPFEHRIYLPDGSTVEQMFGPGSTNWTPLDEISPYMQLAVLTTEDGAFESHKGFNRAAIRASIIANLKARRFVRGASTISMQLSKNLFLSREKVLSRKLEEVALTDYLEQVFTKDEIMALYLNIVEFGPAVYGITAASEYYFGRSPAELNLAECLFLSSLLPAPIRYGAMRDLEQAPDAWMRGLRNLMRIQKKRSLISDTELAEGLSEPVLFWHGGQKPPPRPAVRQRPIGDSDDDTGTPEPAGDAP